MTPPSSKPRLVSRAALPLPRVPSFQIRYNSRARWFWLRGFGDCDAASTRMDGESHSVWNGRIIPLLGYRSMLPPAGSIRKRSRSEVGRCYPPRSGLFGQNSILARAMEHTSVSDRDLCIGWPGPSVQRFDSHPGPLRETNQSHHGLPARSISKEWLDR